MRYRVVVHSKASADLDGVFAWIAAHSPEHAVEWHDRLLEGIRSLGSFPARYLIVSESVELREEVRHLIFGPYRILFVIRGSEVSIVRVLHGARLAEGR
jgi:plasmid stabilization system protein ParE